MWKIVAGDLGKVLLISIYITNINEPMVWIDIKLFRTIIWESNPFYKALLNGLDSTNIRYNVAKQKADPPGRPPRLIIWNPLNLQSCAAWSLCLGGRLLVGRRLLVGFILQSPSSWFHFQDRSAHIVRVSVHHHHGFLPWSHSFFPTNPVMAWEVLQFDFPLRPFYAIGKFRS